MPSLSDSIGNFRDTVHPQHYEWSRGKVSSAILDIEPIGSFPILVAIKMSQSLLTKISFPVLLIAFLVVVSLECSTVDAFGAGNIGEDAPYLKALLVLIMLQLRYQRSRGTIGAMETYVAAASIPGLLHLAESSSQIEDMLKMVPFLRHHKWTSLMVKRVYFGNWASLHISFTVTPY